MSYLADQSHGNYRHYYVRRRANDQYPLPLEQDERLQLLEPRLFKGKVILDVGCNSGEVSVEIAQRFQPSRVVGVDIDNALIDQCRATVEHAFSLQKPLDKLPSSLDAAIGDDGSAVEEPRRKKRKLKNGVAQDVQTPPTTIPEVDTHYFPAFFPQLFGPIDIQGATLLANSRETDGDQDQMSPDVLKQNQPPRFPRNLEYHAADWTNTSIDTDEPGYDVILGFSLTKWIHLHELDEGLVRFFRKCYDTLHEGGVLILEKQGWKGYKQAKRTSETLKSNYQQLKLRPETDFDRILLETVGFSKKETVKETETEKGFDRDIAMYWKLSTRLQPA